MLLKQNNCIIAQLFPTSEKLDQFKGGFSHVCLCVCKEIRKFGTVNILSARTLGYQELDMLSASHTLKNTFKNTWKEGKESLSSINKCHFYPVQGTHMVENGESGTYWHPFDSLATLCVNWTVRAAMVEAHGQRSTDGGSWMYVLHKLVQRTKYGSVALHLT